MSGGVEVIGLAELRANIERAIKENAANVEKAVSQIGDVALLESTKRAPIDEGHLTASLQKRMGRDEDGLSVAVMIPNNSPAAQYALPMHEGNYQPGEKSLKKQTRAGVQVGRKFITRGVDAGRGKYKLIIKKLLGI